ncbi:SusC/RagA family TonB-linked outer membrane protein [Rhizosphaericola mali]|nr:SusC/RagA family TonB-linked outer membrane protein [Rhizosphaericola mali]
MKIKPLKLYLLIFALSAQMTLSHATAQNITINEKNITLENLFKKIEKQSGYSFFYDDAIKNYKVTINVKNDPLNSALKKCLASLSFQFKIENHNVFISRIEQKAIETNTTSNNKVAIYSSNLIKDDKNIEVTGSVVDSTTNTPLVGASVKIKGSTKGVATNESGQFSLNVPENTTLIISYIGYENQEVIVKNGEPINIFLNHLAIDNNDAVVVTALGIKRSEKSLSYDVQKLSNDDLTKVPNANFVNNLSGRVAGIQVNPSSSGIGGASRVVLRGTKSISQTSNGAFYVIDGIPLVNATAGTTSGTFSGMSGTESIADFNPDDFESITVLSGPAAAALYGSQAAQGAILITTKKSAKEGIKVSYSNATSFMSPFIMPKFQNTYGNVAGSFESWGSKLETPSNYNPKDFFQNSLQEMNSVSAAIGSGKSQTLISGAAVNAKGIVPNNKYDRYNFSFRNTTSFLDDKITTDVSGTYVRQTDLNMLAQGQYFNPLLATYLFPRGENFDNVKYFERYDESRGFPVQYWPYGNQGLSIQNPYWTTERMLFPNTRNRYMFSGGITYKPTTWFNVTARGRIDNTNQESEQKFYASTDRVYYTSNSSKGYYSYYSGKLTNAYTDVIATINKRWDDFSLNVNAGTSYQRVTNSNKGYSGPLVTVPNLFALQNVDPTLGKPIESPYDSWGNSAVFGVAEAGYLNRLFLTVSGRNDWNSRLTNSAKSNYFYPSVGLSGVISDMVNLPKVISYLKVRGSYAEVATPLTQLGITPGTITYPISGGAVSTTGVLAFGSYKPETTKSYEAGLNLKLFKNKLGLDVTLYKSNSYNQLIQTQVSGSSGAYTNYFQAGNVSNKGIEAVLSYNLRHTDFTYNTSVAFTLNRNKVVELAPNAKNPDGTSAPITDYVVPNTNNNGRIIQGNPIGDIYVTQLLKTDSKGNIFIGSDGKFQRENKLVDLGSTIPKYTLGWRNDFGYKNFSLGVVMFARVGGIVTSNTQAMLDSYGVSEASAKARDNGGVKINGSLYDAQSYYQQVGGSDALLAYYTYDATNVRLQELSFSYKIPDQLFKDKIHATVSFIANNLWMIYNKAPYDPQLTPSTGTYYQGYDYFMMPSLRSMGFSVKVQF